MSTQYVEGVVEVILDRWLDRALRSTMDMLVAQAAGFRFVTRMLVQLE